MAIQMRLKEKSLTIEGLAFGVQQNIRVGYEQIRKVVRGLSFPSDQLLREIANVLGLKYKELNELMVADQIRERHGQIPAIMSKKNPELQPIELVWTSLSQPQKESLVAMAEAYARTNTNPRL